MFDKELHDNYNKKCPFAANKLFYNQEKDCYICPMGQQMEFIGTATEITATGFKQTVKKYQAKNCATCPLNGACHKAKGNWVIMINENLNRLKKKAHEMLNSEEGIQRRKKRCFYLEPTFGNIKQNHGFRMLVKLYRIAHLICRNKLVKSFCIYSTWLKQVKNSV